MGFPNHSFLWAQWTSEKMNLGTRKKGDGGMDGGRERNTTIKIKPVKWNKHDRTSTQKNGNIWFCMSVKVFLALCYTYATFNLHFCFLVYKTDSNDYKKS